MKIVNCIIIIPFVFGIVCFESGVSCNPTDNSSQEAEVELIDVDVKTLDQTKLTVVSPPSRPEIVKVVPKFGKAINLIKIDDTVICKKTSNYACLDLLIFKTNTERIYIVLKTRRDNEDFYINIVYDPNGSAVSGITTPSYGNNKLRYIGYIPFLIELNKRNIVENIRNENPYGLSLDIDDNFDKWYYNYSYKAIGSGDGRHTFKHGTYEPNEGETFSSVRRTRGNIWSYFESNDSLNSFLKKVEVYSKDGVAQLIKFTSTFNVLTYLIYDSPSDVWRIQLKSSFDAAFSRLGFEASNVDTQGTAQVPTAIDESGTLDVNKLDRSKFDFLKNRLSSVSVVTVVPKEKKVVNRVKFDDINIYPINSDSFSIDFVKWSDNKYHTETIIKHDDHSYNCHYTEQARSGRLEYYDQEPFYHFVKGRVQRREAEYVQNTPFSYLYSSNDGVYSSNPRPAAANPVTTSEDAPTRATQAQTRPQTLGESRTQSSATQTASTTQPSARGSEVPTTAEQPQVINTSESVSSSVETQNVVPQTSLDTDMDPNHEESVENTENTYVEAAVEEQVNDVSQPRPEDTEDEESYYNDAAQFLNFLKSRAAANESAQSSDENNLTVNEDATRKESGFISSVCAMPLVLLALASV